jgi:hypothetical protein
MNDRHAEVVGYGVAGLVLVGGGMAFTTLVLNWVVGPTVVVLAVAGIPPLLSRSRRP